jgi:hypothetical protein
VQSSCGVGKGNKSNIWLSPAFARLWFGQTVSLFGSEITAIALPLTAALVLGATPAEMGILSYLPTLIQREELVSGNSTLEASRAIAQIAGPSIGGPLTAILTPPIAIALDVVSFIVSAQCILSIRVPEPAPARSQDGARRSMFKEIVVGLRAIWDNALLRDTTISSALYNMATGVMSAVYILFATRELGLGAILLGLVFASGNVGVLGGALLTTPLARRFGVGPSVGGLLSWRPWALSSCQ